MSSRAMQSRISVTAGIVLAKAKRWSLDPPPRAGEGDRRRRWRGHHTHRARGCPLHHASHGPPPPNWPRRHATANFEVEASTTQYPRPRLPTAAEMLASHHQIVTAPAPTVPSLESPLKQTAEAFGGNDLADSHGSILRERAGCLRCEILLFDEKLLDHLWHEVVEFGGHQGLMHVLDEPVTVLELGPVVRDVETVDRQVIRGRAASLASVVPRYPRNCALLIFLSAGMSRSILIESDARR